MNGSANVFGAALMLLALGAHAQNTAPTAADIATFKKLAAQTVLHAETSLQKIAKAGAKADPLVIRREVDSPAKELEKAWARLGYSDRVMFEYSACTNLLAEIPLYGQEARRPPAYHLSDFARKKLRNIDEDVNECRRLRQEAPRFNG